MVLSGRGSSTDHVSPKLSWYPRRFQRIYRVMASQTLVIWRKLRSTEIGRASAKLGKPTCVPLKPGSWHVLQPDVRSTTACGLCERSVALQGQSNRRRVLQPSSRCIATGNQIPSRSAEHRTARHLSARVRATAGLSPRSVRGANPDSNSFLEHASGLDAPQTAQPVQRLPAPPAAMQE